MSNFTFLQISLKLNIRILGLLRGQGFGVFSYTTHSVCRYTLHIFGIYGDDEGEA